MTKNNPLQLARFRAESYQTIRAFFNTRDAIEVETPILSRYGSTDFHIDSFKVTALTAKARDYYLQTSPEFFMKRLLSAGSGDIYQICKVFRAEEEGGRHNPEFTMLEWYRVNWSLQALMTEVADLLKSLSPVFERTVEFATYRDVFLKHLSIDPFAITDEKLVCFVKRQIKDAPKLDSRDDYLSLLLSHFVEPKLGTDSLTFLTHYPASQCALAKTSLDAYGNRVAERFELYYNGIELANGFDELNCASEQQQRFEEDQQLRQQHGKPTIPFDKNLIATLEKLPDCVGVALGLDRVLMIASGENNLQSILLFPFKTI